LQVEASALELRRLRTHRGEQASLSEAVVFWEEKRAVEGGVFGNRDHLKVGNLGDLCGNG